MILTMFYYAGQLVDFQIGFSMVKVFDPVSQIQIPLTGNLFFLCVSFLLLLSGAHYNFFRALFYSYNVLPIGESVIANENMLRVFISMYGNFFALGFRTALPIIGSMLVLQLALGILNKASPQMHIFSIGLTVKVPVGLSLLYITLPMFHVITDNIFVYINRILYSVVGGMAP
jgi:flagellar biosynthetic protein FliR